MTKLKLSTSNPPSGANTSRSNPQTVDITPTWSAILPLLLAVYKDGNFQGIKEAEGELKRMAQLADLYVAQQKEAKA